MEKFPSYAHELWTKGQGLEAGKVIYEQLRKDERPIWAANILGAVLEVVPGSPEARNVFLAASVPARWSNTQDLFLATRNATLQTTRREQEEILLLAENVAKVAFNATGLPGAFDHDAGWWVVECARSITRLVGNQVFAERVWGVISQVPPKPKGKRGKVDTE